MSPLFPALALVFNALVWGLSWWPFRALNAQGLHALWATALVFVAASMVVGLVLWLRRAPRAVPMPPHWAGLVALALAAGSTNIGFNWAVATGDVVRVVLLFYLMPAWTVLLAWPMLGERPSLGAMARLALALAGVLLVLKTPEVQWPVPESAADWLAIGGGFAFALTNVLLRRLQGQTESARMLAMFVGGAGTALVVAVLGGLAGGVPWPPAPAADWLLIAAGLGLALLLGNLALQFGAARLPANTSALIMLSELVFATLSSVALGAATLTPRTWAGGGLIVLAALMASWASTPAKEPPP